jgi:antitoxin component YwqK of YwqJK toxin-antitoxin module
MSIFMKSIAFVCIITFGFLSNGCKETPNEIVEESFSNGNVKRIGYYLGEGEKKQKIREVSKHENGQTYMEGAIKDGEREGLWVSFYPGGQKWSECEFSNGKGNGPVTVYYEDGKIRYTGFYSAGIPSGKWIYYDIQGDIVFEKDYEANTTNKK